MREPVTTHWRISYIDRFGRLVVFDRRMSCALCETCLASANGRCWNEGPYSAAGIALHRVVQ